MAVEKCLRVNENKKKRSYGNRVLQIENGSFTPLVFPAISIVKNNIITLICYSLLRSTNRCLRGPRTPRYSHTKDTDIKINVLINTD